jgi:hypothetical protein
MGQHDALTGGQFARKEEIRAERGFDFVLLRERVERVRAREHLERVDPALTHQPACVFFAKKRLGAKPCAIVGRELRGVFIHEMSVFDTLNFGRQPTTDSGRRISVKGDVRIPVSGGFDAGAHLEFAKR